MSGLLGNLKSTPVNLKIPLNTGFTSMILLQCNLEHGSCSSGKTNKHIYCRCIFTILPSNKVPKDTLGAPITWYLESPRRLQGKCIVNLD